MLSESETKSLCDQILSMSNADDMAVSIESEPYSHLRFAANAFSTSGKREDRSASVTVWIGGKRGSSSAHNLSPDSLRAAVEQAEQLAKISPADKEYVPTVGPQTYKPVSGYVEATVNLALPERARVIDSIIRECEKQGVIGAGFHQATGSASGLATR